MIRFDPTVCLVYCNYLDEKQKILQKNKGRYKLIGDLIAGKISLPLEKDCYIAAEVLGNKSPFPVHQARARNGKFDPPWPKTIHLLEASETRDGTGK